MKISKELYNYLMNGQNNIKQIIISPYIMDKFKKNNFITAEQILNDFYFRNISKQDIDNIYEIVSILKTNRDKFEKELKQAKDSYFKEEFPIFKENKEQSFISKILGKFISIDNDRERKQDFVSNNYITVDEKEKEEVSLRVFYLNSDEVVNYLLVDIKTEEGKKGFVSNIRGMFRDSVLPTNNYDSYMPKSFIDNFKKLVDIYVKLNKAKEKGLWISEDYLELFRETLSGRYGEILENMEKRTFKNTRKNLNDLNEIFELNLANKISDDKADLLAKFIDKNKLKKQELESIFVSDDYWGLNEYKEVALSYKGMDLKNVESFYINLYESLNKRESFSADKVANLFENINLSSENLGISYKLKNKKDIEIVKKFQELFSHILENEVFSETTRRKIEYIKENEKEYAKKYLSITERMIDFTENFLIILNDIVKKNGEISNSEMENYKREINLIINESLDKDYEPKYSLEETINKTKTKDIKMKM